MPESIKLLVFDFDDTLVDTSILFLRIKLRFFKLLQRKGFDPKQIAKVYDEIDAINILRLGYVSERTLITMRETLERLSFASGRPFSGADLRAIVRIGSRCLYATPRLMPQAGTLLAWCHSHGYRLALLTRGSESLQSVKLAATGLTKFFEAVKVVPLKDHLAFASVLEMMSCKAKNAVSIGDSLRFDIIPALDVGMKAIYVKYPSPAKQWNHDKIPAGRVLNVPTANGLLDVGSLLRKSNRKSADQTAAEDAAASKDHPALAARV